MNEKDTGRGEKIHFLDLSTGYPQVIHNAYTGGTTVYNQHIYSSVRVYSSDLTTLYSVHSAVMNLPITGFEAVNNLQHGPSTVVYTVDSTVESRVAPPPFNHHLKVVLDIVRPSGKPHFALILCESL